jgi:hypothetical protein
MSGKQCVLILIYGSLMTYHRDNVIPYISGVTGARYKGFTTHEQAARFYLDAKQSSLVSVVRDPGDDEFFGPLRDAMQ